MIPKHIGKNALSFRRLRIQVRKSIQLNNSQEVLGQLPFSLDMRAVRLISRHNLASDLIALVMNAIQLLDATLVCYSYFSKALTQLFFSFFHLLCFQSAIITSVLSSKDLSPLLSKHPPSFPLSSHSSRLGTSGWADVVTTFMVRQ